VHSTGGSFALARPTGTACTRVLVLRLTVCGAGSWADGLRQGRVTATVAILRDRPACVRVGPLVEAGRLAAGEMTITELLVSG
jgi:hypothetical protein